MSTPEFSVPIHDLDAAGKELRFKVRREWVRAALEGDRDLHAGEHDGALDVRVSKSGSDIVVHGTLKAELQASCARCLAPARIAVDEPLSVLMVPSGQVGARVREDGDDEADRATDEADVLTYEGDTVVLDDLVRDEILLAVPMIPLCSENCPGISPSPASSADESAPRGIDPRLAPLLNVKLDRNAKKKKE
jgi:uncharacterized protein